MCAFAGLPDSRADEVLDAVGLTAAAKRRFRGYSPDMRQRLAVATAMVGDPGVLVLDEPTAGLDPAGVRWLRQLLRTYASQGRTVLVASHLLTEIEPLADDIVIIDCGRLVAEGPVGEVLDCLRTDLGAACREPAGAGR
jgi:ABC-2 type transport system ATP-binding protein